jgi:Na+/H+ antiporter NhaD/arsenite permease-like protein
LESVSRASGGSKKNIIGIAMMISFAIICFVLPASLGFSIDPLVSSCALILVSVYIILSFEMIHRTSIALLGALIIVSAAIAFGSVEPEESFDFIIGVIDYNTIGLLLGMMIIVAILANSGVFQWFGIKASKASGGNLWKLMLLLCTFTAIVSMFIDNVTTILLMIPVTISVFRIFKLSPIPFILAQALASNIGGAATLIGDPPNIMIGSAANIDFNSFIIHMGPTIALTFAASIFLFYVFFKKDLKMKAQNLKQLMNEDENELLKDKSILKKSIAVILGVVALFVVHGSIHIEPSIIALGGAAVLLVVTRARPEQILHEVDWPTLIFFTGLFIIVGVAEHAGMIELLSSAAIGITGGNPWVTFFMVIWLSAIGSAFVDNIPFTATMIPIIHTLNGNADIAAAFGGFHISPLWWALALGADLGGNGTLIGSSAGVVAAGISEKYGNPISFIRWFKIGFPFMIATVAIGSMILLGYITLGL